MGMSILVVDDSAVMRAMIIKTLRLSGLPLGAVHEAANGVEGLTALREHHVDVALVDINMPVMSGSALIDRVRENPATASLPIIIVSTDSSEVRVERARARRCAFVHKPFTPETLSEAVRSAVPER